MTSNPIPCPSCQEAALRYPDQNYDIGVATVLDEATGILICEECYDYYNDTYTERV